MATKQPNDQPPLRGAIVAMTRNHVIGIDGGLPWHYSEDLKRFKQRTMNCIIIMGRVTWDSLNRKPLPNRRNIVISRSTLHNVEHYTSIEQAITACEDQDAWIIGGAQIYQAAMTYLNLLDVTYVPDIIKRDDAAKFPPIDSSHWKATTESVLSGEHRLTNIVYHRIA